MNRNSIRYYYQFKEYLNNLSDTTFSSFTTDILSGVIVASNNSFSSLFENVYAIIANRYYEYAIDFVDVPVPQIMESGLEIENFTPTYDIDEWRRQFYSRYCETVERYTVLLGFYASQKANLMNALHSLNKVKFNDTPQDGGDFDSDSHLSSITTSETSSEMMPIINRLDDIAVKFRKLENDWADEFKSLFIQLDKEENVYEEQ